MSDECCFDPQVILDDIPAAIASGALTINNASRIGMSREQFIIAASQSPMGTFVSEEGCCFDIDAILADIPGAIEAGALNQNNAHRIGLSRGGFAVILAMIQGGGGGDFLPLAGGTMDTNADIAFDNGSRIHQTPGSNGIDQVCSIDYVHRWSNGLLYILNQSNQIRVVKYGMSLVPDSSYDSTLGFVIGSIFEQDGGNKYVCTDATATAAVWQPVGAISNPSVAYVQTNGDDGTGEIGNPARPYLTAQAAFDNGAVNFHIGSGITTTINIVATGSDDLTAYLFITGTGLTASVVSVVATAQDGNVDLRVRSNLTCQFGTVEGTSNNGGSCYTEIVAAFVTYFNSQCPSGTASAKAAFSEVSFDLSGLLPSSAYMTRVGATSYP